MFKICDKVLIFFLSTTLVSAFDPPKVCTDKTCYHGTNIKSYDDIWLNVFLGVPYARPPTDSNRFQDPFKWEVEQTPDENVNCKTDVAECAFSDYRVNTKLAHGHEDCLFLNVYTMQNYTSKSLVTDLINKEETQLILSSSV